MPADCSRNTNGPALPSMIGTSAAVSSTMALSMPRPANADSRCSTVETRDSPLTERGAERGVADVLGARARISTGCGRSMRRKHDAGVGGAGLERHHDLLAGMQPDARGADRVLQRPLSDHSLTLIALPLTDRGSAASR